MQFINRYSKKDLFNYNFTEQFNENNNSFIFSVGITEGNGLITKINTEGNIIWERIFNFEEGSNVEFKKIIQVKNFGNEEFQTSYIIHAIINGIHYLLSIDSEECNLNWIFNLSYRESEKKLLLATSKNESSFFICISDVTEKTINDNPFLIKFDNYFNELNNYQIIHDSELIINNLETYEIGIAISGRVTKNQVNDFISFFDSEISHVHTNFLYDNKLRIDSLKSINNENFLIAGHHEDGNIFTAKLGIEEQSLTIFYIQNTESSTVDLCLNSNNFYLTQKPNDLTNSIVYNIDFDFNLLWSKFIDFQNNYGNGIKRISQLNNNLTFDCFNEVLGSLVANTNLSFNTCKTIVFEENTLTDDVLELYVDELQTHIDNNNFREESIEIETTDSNIENQCGSKGENESISLDIFDNVSLQSPNFILNTAGSFGDDGSTEGVHLRWFFGGVLGDLHLPKGNYYMNENFIFNKPNDFVKIYRTPYVSVTSTLDFNNAPNVVNPSQYFWIYKINGKMIYVYFKNTQNYDLALSLFDPLTETLSFIKKYDDGLIEVISKKDLFFKTTFEIIEANSGSSIKTESLSVAENLQTSPKNTYSRKTYLFQDFQDLELICENGRGIRYETTNCKISKIKFEFYSDFIDYANQNHLWTPLGKYSLSLNDNIVLKELEPVENLVNGTWPRFNDGETVNINNYIDKWNGNVEGLDRNIKIVVSQFLELSTDINNPNPTGLEEFSFDFNFEDNLDGTPAEESQDDITSIPLLEVLKFGSVDYHVARMLGLGTLDFDTNTLGHDKYIYISEYITYGNLNDGYGERELQHLSMSLPTSITDERLPMPISIDYIQPGIISENEDENNPVFMTDVDGYTHDGKYRYVSLMYSSLPDDQINKDFYWESEEFNSDTFTFPTLAGVEYRKNPQINWDKPELSNDSNYKNLFQNTIGTNETIPIVIEDGGGVLYIHKQKDSGIHWYSSYGINIFSRATTSPIELNIETELKPSNYLKPPSNVNSLLIRDEEPLLLTSHEEQIRKSGLNSSSDKTLVRLTFDYNAIHEISNYQVEDIYSDVSDSDLESILISGLPNPYYIDEKEIFADEVEIYFRNQVPNSVSGKIISILPDSSNIALYEITTAPYTQASTSNNTTLDILTPSIPLDKIDSFIGGRIINGSQSYIIQEIDLSNTHPKFKVFLSSESSSNITEESGSNTIFLNNEPQIENDGLFFIAENMQNVFSWNNPYNDNVLLNPHALTVQIGIQNSNLWKLNREIIHSIDDYGEEQRYLEKTRGFWQQATIEEVLEPVDYIEEPDGSLTYINGFNGLYKLTFDGFTLPQHVQYSNDTFSVEWFKGVVRLRTNSSFLINGERTNFDVIRVENIDAGDLIIYIQDNSHPGYLASQQEINDYDSVKIGSQLINYYPSYKVYLYADSSINLTEEKTLPAFGDGVKYSIFGLRSHELSINDYYSRFSIPSLMFAQEIAPPQKPQKPLGSKYATRPDFYGKSTYTIEVAFGEGQNSNYKPHGILALRSNDEAVLNAIYSPETVLEIKNELAILGGNDEIWLQDRWDNFFDFDNLRSIGIYNSFPPNEEISYNFPIPDNNKFIEEIIDFIKWHNLNNGVNTDISELISPLTSLNQVIIPEESGVVSDVLLMDFIEQTVKNTFVPLTEVPIIYQYIKPNINFPDSYEPSPKKQKVRDSNGYMLNPTSSEFEMAPMCKRISQANNKIKFTDFTIDGTSKNIYFYSVKEMNNQMQMGELSDIVGPIKLVNTNPPEAPEIKKVIPQLENRILGISPSIKFEINHYAKIQNVKKINLYRSFNRLDAQSIRTMELVKIIDLESENIIDNNFWNFIDDFSDLNEIRYGDPVYYRITVSRKVEYSEGGNLPVIEYAPSEPSKIIATLLVENYTPESPMLEYYSEPLGTNEDELNYITLSFDKTVYNGKYHIYKMNNQGNWSKIYEIDSNDETIYIHLEETNLQSPNLTVLSEDGSKLYHHFKAIAENTAGMLSNKENILTIYNEVTWQDIGGISSNGNEGMIINGTFIVREN